MYLITQEKENESVGKLYWSMEDYVEKRGVELHTWIETGTCSDMPYLELESCAKKLAKKQ